MPDRPRAFITAPNRSEIPGHVENVPTGILMVYPDGGGYDYRCLTVEDEAEVFDHIDTVNWENPEVADYLRERMDAPDRMALWEVEVQDGETINDVFSRLVNNISRDSAFVIYAAWPVDADRILAVYRQCEDFLALGPVPSASMEMVQADLNHSSKSGSMYGVIVVAGEPIGVIDYRRSGHDGDDTKAGLYLLMLAKAHRGKGLGTAVVAQIEREIAQDPDVTGISAGVQVNNPQAIAFWRGLGYQIVSGPKAQPDGTTTYELWKPITR